MANLLPLLASSQYTLLLKLKCSVKRHTLTILMVFDSFNGFKSVLDAVTSKIGINIKKKKRILLSFP